MAKVLIVDDDDLFCEMVASALELNGHEVRSAGTVRQGLEACRTGAFDVVFLDIRLPDGNGLEQIPVISSCPSEPEIIIITAAGDPHGAELAISSGAWDYLSKPSPLDELLLTLQRALRYRKRKANFIPRVAERQGIVGNSPRMQACLDLMAEFAPSEAAVLISGETGTGKELFARAIHKNSARAAGPFITVDCAAIAKNLIESELFGYEKGAFTGADRARDGLFLQADGGTLFLDEVGELPLSQQKAFLRVLQERTFRRVGGEKELHSDFRLVAATNRDLRAMVKRGAFREDLLFRLQAVLLKLPPLRDRGRDIQELALYHLEKLCLRYKLTHKKMSAEASRFLLDYPWPGNVRELVHVIEQAVVAARNEQTLQPEHLPRSIRAVAMGHRMQQKSEGSGREADTISSSVVGQVVADTGPNQLLPTWKAYRENVMTEMERHYLLKLLDEADGNISQAGRISGLSRQRLYALLKRNGINRAWPQGNSGAEE
ncbi:sigma-54-dependent transcriptional regulator [Oleidesulfovibrio sp.]|uniref:sigma-54-dependent transcriptional regulator n=1 Tax=Oleidesulfovibrio sp. TaxID=2909707 RepID=UPI003A88C6D1